MLVWIRRDFPGSLIFKGAMRRTGSKRKILAKIILVILAILVFWLAVWLVRIIRRGGEFLRETGLTPGNVMSLLLDSGATLKESAGRTNVLLLGVGGGSHAGADLTDTMLVVSLEKKSPKLSLISIPRDMWIDSLKDKINSAYHYGEQKKIGGGLVLAKSVAEDALGLSIQYAILIDFSGFEKIIDLAGGIEVDVAQGFVDTQYPLAGKENDECDGDKTYRCRYEELSFVTGRQFMNGETALKYVRSRHATGDEGTDFARSRRQQEVILALKQKLVQPEMWRSIDKARGLYRAFDQATDTDLTIGELLTLGKIGLRVNEAAISRISIEDQLIVPPQNQYGGRYVLIPKNSITSVYQYVASRLK